jgi:phosphoribosylanthranilate isomerase
MPVAVKFCGLTRREDAEFASELGASYGGVIFAGGPRQLDERRAAQVLQGLAPSVRRVGVMGAEPPREMAARALGLGLHVIQMHADPLQEDIDRLSEHWAGAIWAVLRADDVARAGGIVQVFRGVDGILVDSGRGGTLGGTGRVFDWASSFLRAMPRASTKLVLAGGLTAANVAEAIAVVHPDVVDVSSGVESGPGIKDHGKMRDFATAVLSASGE